MVFASLKLFFLWALKSLARKYRSLAVKIYHHNNEIFLKGVGTFLQK